MKYKKFKATSLLIYINPRIDNTRTAFNVSLIFYTAYRYIPRHLSTRNK